MFKKIYYNRGTFLKKFLNSFFNDLNDFLPNNNINYKSKSLTNYMDIETPFISIFSGYDILTKKDKNYNYNSYTKDNIKTPFI